MIPRQSKLGTSFKFSGIYYLHDRQAMTSERVAFTHVENLPTECPERALRWMAWTAKSAEQLKMASGADGPGKQCAKPVLTFSLSWHPEEAPDQPTMIDAGRSALAALGLQEHQAVFVAHSDGVPHVHLIVNTVNPTDGKVNRLQFSKLKLSRWAEQYERQRGKIYCEARVENNEQRQQGEYVKYREPELERKKRIAQLYHAARDGKDFQEKLAREGYQLAQGKRIVLIDEQGSVYSLSRQIEGVKAKHIRAKLADISLPLIDEIAKSSQSERKDGEGKGGFEKRKNKRQDQTQADGRKRPDYFDRDEQDRDWQESIIDAAISGKEERFKPKPEASTGPSLLNALQNRHLVELGDHYQRKHDARMRLAEKLEAQYGAYERDLRRDAAQLEQVLANSGPLRRLILKATGQIPKNADETLRNMRQTLENIEWRKAQDREALEADISRRERAIEYRHERETLEMRRETMEQAGARDEISAELDRVTEMDEDFGPSPDY